MKKSILVISLILSSAAFAQTNALKPGLWEVKIVRQVMDGKDMGAQMAAAQAKMQESMAKMSPQQRQQIEQMMKGSGVQSQGGAIRMCISAEMAAKNESWNAQQSQCPPTKVTHSGNKVAYEINCTTNGHTMVGRGESVVSGDKVTVHTDMTMTDAHGKHAMLNDSEMSYLGADCKGLQPVGEIARKMKAKH